jgi:hypothetical protein
VFANHLFDPPLQVSMARRVSHALASRLPLVEGGGMQERGWMEGALKRLPLPPRNPILGPNIGARSHRCEAGGDFGATASAIGLPTGLAVGGPALGSVDWSVKRARLLTSSAHAHAAG